MAQTPIHDNPYALGLAQVGAGHFEMARMFLERAVAEHPDNAHAWFNLGYALGKLGDNEGRFAAYHRALSIDPKYAEARHSLGIAYLLKGDPCAAMAEANKLRTIDTEYARKLITMIRVILSDPFGSDCSSGGAILQHRVLAYLTDLANDHTVDTFRQVFKTGLSP